MEIEIRALSIDDPDFVFDKVAGMFAEMYDFMEEKGLVLSLAENGETIWLNSLKPSLGKLNMVFIAFDGDEIIGFVTGSIKLSPAFLKSKKIGYISHLYVDPKFRKSKAGSSLMSTVEDWFQEKQVDHVEAEVLVQNASALKFLHNLGYVVDNQRIYKKL